MLFLLWFVLGLFYNFGVWFGWYGALFFYQKGGHSFSAEAALIDSGAEN